ncbi:MAG TPA: ATP synthase F0 subunit B [Terriglobales bacterium]|nr:ATP synthase F0 subunit B [Terriglobales bacterium]
MKASIVLRGCALFLVLAVVMAGLGHARQSPDAATRKADQGKKAQSQSSAQSSPAGGHSNQQEGGLESGSHTIQGELSEASREAAGEEEGNAQFKHSATVRLVGKLLGLSPEGAYWVAVLSNFAVIIAVVVYFWRKKLAAAFRARNEAIRKGIEEARRASEDANRRLSEVESRLASLGGEIDQMKAAAEKDAAAEEERLREAAQEDKRKIVTAAEQEIEAASKAARRQLKAYAAELAVALAEKKIQVDPATDRTLVSNFVRELGGNNR